MACFTLFQASHKLYCYFVQFTFGLHLTNQSYLKNISMLFKSVTTTFIFSICLLISNSSDTNLVTSLFLVSFILKTLNNLSISFVLIYFSFTNCLLISVWVHSELISVLSYSFFLFDVFMFVCILSFLFFCYLSFIG